MPRTILQMRNLGPRCNEWLAEIGIHDESDLRAVGAVAAYREPERAITEEGLEVPATIAAACRSSYSGG